MSHLIPTLHAGCRSDDEPLHWHPRMFRLGRADDRRQLTALIAGLGECLRVHDTLLAQLRDLVKTRHPSRRLTPQEIDGLVTDHLAGTQLHEYGVWAFYPWSSRLVHLLDGPEFAELRTNRNCYKIAPAEQALLSTKRAGIVGLSAGQAIAMTIALERSVGELRLADFDRIDLSNLNRLQTGIHNIGLPKVCVTARQIAELDPFLTVTGYEDGISAGNVDSFLLDNGRLDVVIEECDSIDVKVLVRQRARAHRIPVVMQTSDRGMLDVERFDLEPERALFHGLTGELDASRLGALSTEEKVPYVLRILGADSMSTRARASMLEIEQTISTWPQLGSEVLCGGGTAAHVVRRILLGQHATSGRVFVDLDALAPSTPPRGFEASVTAPDTGRELPVPGVDVLTQHLVSQAILAPSGGNAQPWRWCAAPDALHLHLDSARSSGLIDLDFSGSYVALGCAAETFILAAHASGHEVRMRPFPVAGDLEHAATFQVVPSRDETTVPHWRDELSLQIPLRRTTRRMTRPGPLPAHEAAVLTAAVRSVRSAGVQWLTGEAELVELGQLVGAADRMRFLHPRLHEELVSELRWTPADADATRDGIEVAALYLSPTDRAGLEIVRHGPSVALVREWNGGRNLEKLGPKLTATASAVGLITMPRSCPIDYFEAGRAVQRMWLTATERQLAVHPISTLPYLFSILLWVGGAGLDDTTNCELRRLRRRYEGLFHLESTTAEVLLFRVGSPEVSPPPSRRRPLADVLTSEDRSSSGHIGPD